MKTIFLTSLIFLSGCGFFQKQISTESRIQSFHKLKLKTTQPVEVLWTENLIPRIKAENSPDLFYTLGVVQMFLRQSQLELYRNISNGALSEMAGPVSLKIDKFLKSIDFDHAAQISYSKMSKESIEVLDHMARGMNDYIEQEKNKSADLKIFGIKNKKWTSLDLVRVFKLTSIDVNWTVITELLEFQGQDILNQIWSAKVKEKDFFTELFKKIKSDSSKSADSKNSEFDLIANNKGFKNRFEFLNSFAKSGSNAFVVHGQKTKSKSALLSSDPHLGYVIPNFWVFVILDSPEYKTMGYLIPSFPVPVIGRNMDIAWGGTNLWGISTYPTLLDDNDQNKIETINKKIKVRFWFDSAVDTYKLGDYPVLKAKDFPEIGSKDVVFKWQGYEPSNELETFLNVNKAKNFSDFHTAFKSYRVGGMTFVYGDRAGNVGKVVAFSQPQVDELKITYDKNDFRNEELNSLTLPYEYNPKNNFVVSANDFTKGLRQPMSIFQAPNDRKNRMEFLLSQKSDMTVDDVKEIQSDVFSQTAFDLKNKLVAHIENQKWVNQVDENIFQILKSWDGNYNIKSKGALVFEVFIAAWAKDIINHYVFNQDFTKNQKTKLFDFLVKQFDYRTFLIRSLNETDFLTKSKFDIYFSKVVLAYEKYGQWGEYHQLDLRHPLGNLKLFKYPYSYFKGPWAGGNETLMKSTHKLSVYNGKANFGAQARWIVDASDVNENYLVYLGGQDGFIKSKNINDLTTIWQNGEYLKIPFDRDQFLKISNFNGQ